MESLNDNKKEEILFAVKIICKRAKASDGSTVTQAGEEVWVVKGEWGPTCEPDLLEASYDELLIFKREKEAKKFAEEFDGHPWYYEKKSFKIVPVVPVYKTILSHYKEKGV